MRHFVFLDAYADAGETAAMQLYKELDADYLLIDDRCGRKVAAINQIKTIGSMGGAAPSQTGRAGCVHRTLACAH
jgi:predicted nucleic acid-binding protein